MKRQLALAGFIVLAALTRLLPHPPNFAPITAVAIFGGVMYLSRRHAVLVPIFALLLTDLVREVLFRYGLVTEWGIYRGMWAVYATTAVIVGIGRLAHGSRSPLALGTVTLAGSCTFFLSTNFAVWAWSGLYPLTSAGLVACYTAAIPFFKYALMGDALYSLALFGLWIGAEAAIPALRLDPKPATV